MKFFRGVTQSRSTWLTAAAALCKAKGVDWGWGVVGNLLNSKRKIIFPFFPYFKINSSISRKLKGIASLIYEKYCKTTIKIIKLR